MVKSSAQDVGTLFSLHGPMVFRRALRLMGRKEDAEEVTQEVAGLAVERHRDKNRNKTSK